MLSFPRHPLAAVFGARNVHSAALSWLTFQQLLRLACQRLAFIGSFTIRHDGTDRRRILSRLASHTQVEELDWLLVSLDLIAFMYSDPSPDRLLGLTVNFGFNVMLAAAHDLLKEDDLQLVTAAVGNETKERTCNPVSTGSFLIADTFAALIGISVAPLLPIPDIRLQISLTAALAFISFCTTALSHSYLVTFIGVSVGAFAAGFGEAVIMTFASKFDKNIVSGYAAGFGAAGITSSAAYLLLTFLLPIQSAILVMLVVPGLLLLDFWLVIKSPDLEPRAGLQRSSVYVIETKQEHASPEEPVPSWADKFAQLQPLLPSLMIPIFISTFFMCFMNQGLFELVFLPSLPLSRDVQYRLLITLSQLGLFVGQSSAQLLQLHSMCLLSILEAFACLLVLGEVLFPLQHVALVFVITIMGGMIGGATFANTFYQISEGSGSGPFTSFNMEVGMLANELGAVAAGVLAIPAHMFLCEILSRKSL